ncbi:MAG: HypC/HybG/HupF family hydrogenase formation chaperone [Candidatus Bathyarchaeota archaeon]|nr:HypC/HybG/HupF family hydrogenase formation chaperone [Candidatus Bathyarchaeota archaeon]
MCLAIPAKIIEKEPNRKNAMVDFGEGTIRKINISLVDVKIGEYVLIHAGFAIEVLDESEAKETLRIWEEILNS